MTLLIIDARLSVAFAPETDLFIRNHRAELRL